MTTKEHTDPMIKFRLTARRKAAALVAVSTGLLTAGTGLMALHQAAADPGSSTAYAGVGSDTTQDVMNALAGATPWPGAGNVATATPEFYSASSNPTGGPLMTLASANWK